MEFLDNEEVDVTSPSEKYEKYFNEKRNNVLEFKNQLFNKNQKTENEANDY